MPRIELRLGGLHQLPDGGQEPFVEEVLVVNSSLEDGRLDARDIALGGLVWIPWVTACAWLCKTLRCRVCSTSMA